MRKITETEEMLLKTDWGISILEKVKKLKEREKGRSENYWRMSAEEQWAEDKRLGILDWDGK